MTQAQTARLRKLHDSWSSRWPDVIPDEGIVKHRLGGFLVRSMALKLGNKVYFKYAPEVDIEHLHPKNACAMLRKELTRNSDLRNYPWPSKEGALLFVNDVHVANWVPQQGGLIPTLDCHEEFMIALSEGSLAITFPFPEFRPKGLKP